MITSVSRRLRISALSMASAASSENTMASLNSWTPNRAPSPMRDSTSTPFSSSWASSGRASIDSGSSGVSGICSARGSRCASLTSWGIPVSATSPEIPWPKGSVPMATICWA